jgi:hypothetical protein
VTVSRPPEIGAGDEVRLGDATATILAVTAEGVHLQDVTGVRRMLTRGELLASPGFQVVTARTAPLPRPRRDFWMDFPRERPRRPGGNSTSPRS